MKRLFPAFFTLLLGTGVGAHAAPPTGSCQAKSGDRTIALLELYTSEGCNSCPPADRWVLELPRNGYGPERVVPLAFHVDYWNYLGWVDPFAQRAFTQRQHEFARRTNASTVYTPEVVLNGREYRGWRRGSLDSALDRVGRQSPRANLTLALDRSGKTLHIRGDASLEQDAGPANLYVALYENNLRTEVPAGENRGRTLEHGYVVRRLFGPINFTTAGKAQFEQQLSAEADWKLDDLGVAAFVQEAHGTGVLQALALDACS